MSTLALQGRMVAPREQDARVPRSPVMWLAMLLVGGAFFLTEHDWWTSQADSFTQTADQMQAAAAGGDLLRRLAYPVVGLFGLGLLLTPAGREVRVDPWLATLLAAFLGWCALSVLWSHQPGMTLRRLVVLACLVTAALGVARHVTSRELMAMGVIVPAVYLGLGFLAEVHLGTFRPWEGEHRFSGTQHPNTQGIHLACLCLSSACLLQTERRRRGLLIGLFAAGFVFLWLTKSRTSTAGVLVALTACWTMTTPLRTKLLLGLAGSWCVAALALGLLLAGMDVERDATDAALMGREEQAESLTGRLPIWTELSTFVAARPLAGYGYDSFWTPDHIAHVSEELQWGIREAHSTFVDGVLGVGVLGMLPACLAVFVAMLRCQQRYGATGDPVYGLLLGLYVFGLINACTESAMLMPGYYTFVAGTGLLFLATRNPAERGASTPSWQGSAPPPTARDDDARGTPGSVETRRRTSNGVASEQRAHAHHAPRYGNPML